MRTFDGEGKGAESKNVAGLVGLESADDRDYAFADLFAELKSASVETLFEVAKVPGVQVGCLSNDGSVESCGSFEGAGIESFG